MSKFRKETYIESLPERVFGFHELPDAFERLMPPWEKARVVQKAEISRIGSQAVIEQKIFGLVPTRWVAEHTAYDPPNMFEDVQISGPFAEWKHKHLVKAKGTGALLIDDIEYKPPMGPLGSFADRLLIVPKLEKLFEYRHRVTREWCESGAD